MTPEELLRSAFAAGIAAVHPARTLARHLPTRNWEGRTILFALGKAAATMAAEAILRLDVDEGLVIAPHGTDLGELSRYSQLRLLTAAHPLPDDASLAAGQAALALAAGTGPRDRLIALVSGGGSSLMVAPADGVSLAEKRTINQALLASGAPIDVMNIVRARLSRVKGGRLLRHIDEGCRVHTIIMSDVPSDDPHLVASGPTVARGRDEADPTELCVQYGIQMSTAAAQALKSALPSSPRPGDTVSICANGETMLAAVTAHLQQHGILTTNLGSAIEGDAVELARGHADRLFALDSDVPYAIVSGGETTVRLTPGAGRGGRNLTYALALALAFDGRPDAYGLAADTDGIDGNSGLAGAIVSPDTLTWLRKADLTAEDLLETRNSAAAFASSAVLRTGPTGVNVNDLRIAMRTTSG